MKYILILTILVLSSIQAANAASDSPEAKVKEIQTLSRAANVEKEVLNLLKNDKSGWVKIDRFLGEKANYKTPTYALESVKEAGPTGDLQRYSFYVTKKGEKKKELLDPVPLSGVQVLARGKYLLLEPLVLIKTKDWKRTDLAKSVGLNPYFEVLRYTEKSGHLKILLSQFDCAMDCPKDDKQTIWEIELKD